MSLEPEQRTALHLAGCIALPSPQPAAGAVDLLVAATDRGEPADVHLRVTLRSSPTALIRWTVDLDHVRGIAMPATGEHPGADIYGGMAILGGKEARALAGKLLASSPLAPGGRVVVRWLPKAVVYVPEATPVLRTAEAAMTAAESAEYLPPASADPQSPFGSEPESCGVRCGRGSGRIRTPFDDALCRRGPGEVSEFFIFDDASEPTGCRRHR